MFYVAPLFCIALLAWVERGAPRPRVLAAVAAVVSALLVVAIPFDRFLTTSAITDTLMLLPLWSLQDRIGEDWITLAALALAAGARGGVPLRARGATRSRSRCSSSASGSSRSGRSGGGRTASSGSRAARSSRGSARPIATGSIRRLPPARRAAFLWTGRTDRLTVNQNEFFNRGVGPVYYVTDPTPGGLPETRVRIDPKTGARDAPGRQPGARPVPPRRLVVRAGRQPRSRRTRAGVSRSGACDRRSSPPFGSTASIRTTRGRATTVTYTPATLHAGTALRLALERPEPLPRAADRSSRARTAQSSGACGCGPRGERVLSVPVAPVPGTTDCRVVYTVDADGGPGRGHRRREPAIRASSARTSTASSTGRRGEDRVRRVSRSRHPLLGIGNYIQGSLGRARRGGRGQSTRSSRSRRRASAGPSGSALRSPGSTSRCARGRCPSRTRCARHGAGSAARPPSGSSARSTSLHFSDWMYPPQRAGVRATTIHDLVPLHHPEWTTAQDAVDARPQVPERGRRRATSSS